MPVDNHQSLSDLPVWLWLLASFAGLSGELWRAEAIAGLTAGELIKRITLRWGASSTFGMCSGMLAFACGAPPLAASAITGIVACNGADLASHLYARWIRHKLAASHEHA